MTDLLTTLLSERDWLLADGATGTNLFAAGLEAGEAPELWNVDAPEKIRALHDGFIEAGSDLILTNSFGGTRYRLKLHNAEDRVYELNKRAAEIARKAVEASGRQVVVAGSMGPTGELLEPVGALSMEDAVAAFEEQAKGLIDGGADVLWAETISSEEEIRAAAQAAANLDAPFCGTLSFDTAGRTMMGVTSASYAEMSQELPATPIAFGANCGVGASDLLRTVLGMNQTAPGAVLIAKANAGIPKYVDGKIEYDGTPELMAQYARLARRSGARIIGGCCGTMPVHLVAMRAALEEGDFEAPPALDEIEAQTGGFSSADDGLGGAGAAPKRERRGRRRG
ncbi:MAG: betaine--homocysteine S-methyltransferase [Pseudomonadota bacterium]